MEIEIEIEIEMFYFFSLPLHSNPQVANYFLQENTLVGCVANWLEANTLGKQMRIMIMKTESYPAHSFTIMFKRIEMMMDNKRKKTKKKYTK